MPTASDKLFLLSDLDRRQLIEIIDIVMSSRPNRSGFGSEEPISQANNQLLALTPDTGLPARSGNTLTGKLCKMFKLTYVSATSWTIDKIIEAGSQWEEYVFHLDPVDPVGATKIVLTDITAWGMRYVLWESCNDETSEWYL